MSKMIYADPRAARAARAAEFARSRDAVERLIRDNARAIREDVRILATQGAEYRDPPTELAGLYAELARTEGMLAVWMVFTGQHNGEDMPTASLGMSAAAERIRVDLAALRNLVAGVE